MMGWNRGCPLAPPTIYSIPDFQDPCPWYKPQSQKCGEACLGRCLILLINCHRAEEEWQVGHPNRAAVPGGHCSVATCPPPPGKVEGGARRDASVSISCEFRCFSLPHRYPVLFLITSLSLLPCFSKILCSFSQCRAHISAKFWLENFPCFWVPVEVLVWEGVTWMGAHLGLRHLLVKLSESIQKLKYLNNYLHEGQGVTPLCFSEKKMFSVCTVFLSPVNHTS